MLCAFSSNNLLDFSADQINILLSGINVEIVV